jgi:xylitol oxidase
VVTRLSLDVLPAFDLRQYVYEDLPRERLDDSFDEIFAAGYSVSVFTDWRPGPVSQVWLKQRVPAGKSGQPEPALVDPGWLGARLADGPRHPVRGMSAENTTQQLGVPGPWHERLPHFRPEFRPSTASELQSEFLLPREHTGAAFRAIEQIRDVITPVLQVSEIRTVAADGLWLSPSYGRDTACLHFTWTDDLPAVIAALTEVESRLAPLGARPHWGKLFGVGDLSDRYERMDDFLRLASDFDPQRKFSNDFTAACLGW